MPFSKKPKHMRDIHFDAIELPVASISDNLKFIGLLGRFDLDVYTISQDNNFILIGEAKNLDAFANYWAERKLYGRTL